VLSRGNFYSPQRFSNEYDLSMADDFAGWLRREIDERGWTQAELSRRSGLVPSAVSNVLNRERLPGIDFCKGVARAFGVGDVEVMRMAGIADPERERYSFIVESTASMLNELSEEDQEDFRALVRSKWERKQRKQVARKHE
jgi:transcriptional regulator with XRE-family HTH domain